MTAHRYIEVAGVDVFYREAGDAARPSVLLLHGFPSSSHMFRRLISRLSDRFHCVAPDLPGFGYTQAPPPGEFEYTFEQLASVTAGFVDAVGLERFSLYVFDFGAPVGLRLATAQPERIEALIVQNGNLYTEGLSDQTQPLQDYWRDRSGNEQAIRGFLSAEMTQFQQRPPTLVVWGQNDPFFTIAGAQSIERDQPDAEIHLFDTGHFALEERDGEIAAHIGHFLAARLPAATAV